MSDKSPMTVEGHNVLKAELKRLKGIERPKASKAIEVARAHGDLSENAEYDAAKEAQGMLEARIRLIESHLATAQVVDVNTLKGDRVIFGATVRIVDIDSDEDREIMIVGEDEADADRGLISYLSPLARGLIGKQLDDLVTVRLPGGQREYEITGIKFETYRK